MHEQIENEYIIGLLQQRSQTVYNVHSDNKLSEMLSLFEKGLQNVKVTFKYWYLTIIVYTRLWYITVKICQQSKLQNKIDWGQHGGTAGYFEVQCTYSVYCVLFFSWQGVGLDKQDRFKVL